MPWSERHSARPSTFIALIDVRGIRRSFGSEPRMRGSAGRIMIRPGQAIMIAWLTTAHAPLWEPAHERARPKKQAFNYAKIFLRKDILVADLSEQPRELHRNHKRARRAR